MKLLDHQPRNIAILCASRLGDYVCATPALRALRFAAPSSDIALIGLPTIRELAMRSTAVNRFVEFPGFPGIAEQFFSPRKTVSFLSRMQAERFDLAIQLHGSGVNSNPFTLLLGAERTAGFTRPRDPYPLLDVSVPYRTDVHAIDRYLSLVTALGAEPRGRETEIVTREDDHREAESWLEGRGPFIGLHAGSRDDIKKWPLQSFADVGKALLTRIPGRLVLIGSNEDRLQNAELARLLEGRVIDLTGKTTLGVLGAVIERLSLLITTDSGPAHIAYATGTPTITLFGPTSPIEWGPPSHCRHVAIWHHRLEELPPALVLSESYRTLVELGASP